MKKHWVRILIWILIAGSACTLGLAQSGRNRSAPKPKQTEAAPKAETPPPAARQASQAEKAEAEDMSEAGTIKIEAALVTVPVVVSDQTGRYIPFLKQEDFKLYEDSSAQEITFFASEQVPFNVAIVLDMSGSIKDSVDIIQESAVRFVRELKDDDKVMVVEFNDRVDVLNDLTSDRNKIRHSINTTRSHGATRLYDALYETAKRMTPVEGRKAIILLTDGEDTASNKSSNEALEAILECGSLMYVIQFPASMSVYGSGPNIGIGMPPTFPGGRSGGTLSDRPDASFLKDLITLTGGDMYLAGGRSGLPNIWRKIADELRHVYVLGYYPTNAVENGGKRRIKVQLKDATGKARYKPSYTPPKQHSARK